MPALSKITPSGEWGRERSRDILSFHFLIERKLVSKSPMAGRKGYTSEWESNYVPQVINVMLSFNGFMDKELICVLFSIGVL